MNKNLIFVLLLVSLMLGVGCAASSNAAVNTPGSNGNIAGFWLGYWHGLIILYAFVASLFSNTIGIYEVHNNGVWYNLGYLLSLGSLISIRFAISKR
ncbi:MAG: hypothetical protein M1338_04195 [Patescibacteria group bacterium]|nr:hypothetical protein [Patescibacteria group bacterium]